MLEHPKRDEAQSSLQGYISNKRLLGEGRFFSGVVSTFRGLRKGEMSTFRDLQEGRGLYLQGPQEGFFFFFMTLPRVLVNFFCPACEEFW